MSEVRILLAAPASLPREIVRVTHLVLAGGSTARLPMCRGALGAGPDAGVGMNADEDFMRLAIAEAAAAADGGDVPVGCVLVKDGVVLARAHNHRQRWQDPVAHAEVLAIRAAAEQLGSFRLIGVTAYVTLEPCVMCAGALVNARVPRVVYGCDDPKAGALRSLYSIGTDPRLNHRFEITPGVLGETCATQLSSFFSQLRAQRRCSSST